MIVKYSKKFPYAPYLNEDIGFEMEIADSDDPFEALKTLKGIAEKFHKDSNPGLHAEYSEVDGSRFSSEPQEARIGDIANDILSCKDLKTLESYKLIVKAKPELQGAYDTRYQYFQKTTT